MGCVAKRRGRYVIDCYDQNGNRYRKTLKLGTNKEDAKKLLRELEARIERGTFLHEKKTPLFKDVARRWLDYKKTKIRITSWETYQGHVKNHFDSLNDYKITAITIAKIERFISAKQESNMNITTLKKIIVTLNQIMKYAIRHRLIDYNPVIDAEKPSNQGKENKRQIISIMEPEQIVLFLDAVEKPKYRTLFLTAILTGARQGEILGLKWEDVDFENRQINIRRTFNNGSFFQPKTEESKRNIDLSPLLVRELAAWKLKTRGQDNDLVFPSEAGTPICKYNMVRRHFLPALKKAGIPRIRFHDLRHGFASLLIEQGENIKYIQNQLGHSTPTVTLNVYAHLMKKTNQDAVCKLEKTIFGSSY